MMHERTPLDQGAGELKHIEKIKLSITDACEGTCDFCYRGPINGTRYLPKNAILEALGSLTVRPKSIHISGGNPLLHPDFREIVIALKSLSLPIKLSANPKLFLKRFRDLLPVFRSISLSLNASNEKDHDKIRGIKGDWDALFELATMSSRPKISVVVVLNPDDLSGAAATIEAARRLRPDTLKVQLIERSLQPKHTDALDSKNRSGASARENLLGIFSEFSGAPDVELIPRISSYTSVHQMVDRYLAGEAGPGLHEEARCNYMLHNPHIKESGDVLPCCGLSDDRVIGNILKEPLQNILNRHFSSHSNHSSLTFPSCQQCIFYSHYNPTSPVLIRNPRNTHVDRNSKLVIPITEIPAD